MRATPPTMSEAVVGSVQNKTLCSSPDNTRDFARSAHLVSTPCVWRPAPPAPAPTTSPGTAPGPRTEGQENIQQMNDLEEKLKQELEEKERLLVLRRSQPTALDQVDEGGAGGRTDDVRKRPAVEPFHIFSDPLAGRPSPNPLHNEVFLRPGEKGLSLKIKFPAPRWRRGNGKLSRCHGVLLEQRVTPCGLLVLHQRATPPTMSEAVVGSVQNKTLCSSPDNTRDFARSAHLVSTPCVWRPAPPAPAPTTSPGTAPGPRTEGQ
ncbi:hypothetical protein CRUP_033128, partial [Coryphaenoides rupestris]